jgi:hypothetical protein
VISRKKAGKQARTIIVTKEEAEIVDVGVRPKKRGRPRKIPSVDPPDPRDPAASFPTRFVLDPGKGVCADPGKGVCADPADGGAILERGEPDPHSRNRERQLAPDKARGRT